MSGPYETSREAFEDARVLRESVAAADPGNGSMTQAVIAARSRARLQYLRGVLEVCGVQLGAYDKRIAEWAAGWDLETIQVITGWVERARAAASTKPAEPVACGRCGGAFDPTDTAFDGRARYAGTLFCRGCIDQCHEADADHRCIICAAGGAR